MTNEKIQHKTITPIKIHASNFHNRKQKVKMDDPRSPEFHLKKLLPKGSVPSPIPFILFINDTGALKLEGELTIFADYVTQYYHADKTKTS